MNELGNTPADKGYKPSGISKAAELWIAGVFLAYSVPDTTVKELREIAEKSFIAGYEQATKDTIERAIAWLKENANKYIVDIGVGYGEHGRNVELVVGGMCWEHLQQELEAKK